MGFTLRGYPPCTFSGLPSTPSTHPATDYQARKGLQALQGPFPSPWSADSLISQAKGAAPPKQGNKHTGARPAQGKPQQMKYSCSQKAGDQQRTRCWGYGAVVMAVAAVAHPSPTSQALFYRLGWACRIGITHTHKHTQRCM